MTEDSAAFDDPESLTKIYKKNGSFDQQRKALLDKFRQSETHANLLLKLKVLVESKIQSDPSILLKNKGMMSALIQGEIMNVRNNTQDDSARGSDLLSIVDRDIKENITDSQEFRSGVVSELHIIKQEAMGISKEEYEKQLDAEKENANEHSVRQLPLNSRGHSHEASRRRDLPSSSRRDFFQQSLSNRVSKTGSRIDSHHQTSRNYIHKPRDDDQSPSGSHALMY